jgi:hypothetical protein
MPINVAFPCSTFSLPYWTNCAESDRRISRSRGLSCRTLGRDHPVPAMPMRDGLNGRRQTRLPMTALSPLSRSPSP